MEISIKTQKELKSCKSTIEYLRSIKDNAETTTEIKRDFLKCQGLTKEDETKANNEIIQAEKAWDNADLKIFNIVNCQAQSMKISFSDAFYLIMSA